MSEGQLKIHSENILPIIKRWLYSDKEIFLRELVSNATDALQKVKWLGGEGPLEISVEVKEGKLLISDSGIGMSASDVENYIAQIAFSGAEEFVKQHEKLGDDAFIGHFGLGFYSAYMVADLVEIDSSKEGEEAVHWSCDGGSTYSVEKGTREKRGTTITLHINEESKEYLEPTKLRELLKKYCSFLPFPISLNGSEINNQNPLFVKAPADCTKEDYLAFYKELYPLEPEPHFWIHLNVDYPFHLKGVLYFPKEDHQRDLSQSNLQLYCNRVYVTDECKEILPRHLTLMKGVIDSPDIPLNVSRSALQMDSTVKQVGSHISKKVCDSLRKLYNEDRLSYIKSFPDLEAILKIGAIDDEKFCEKVSDLILFETVEGSWTTAKEYVEKCGNRLLYIQRGCHSPLVDHYREKEIDLLISSSYLDPHLFPRLERGLGEARFVRLDGELNEELLDSEETSDEAAAIFRQHLGEQTIEAKSFKSEAIPALLIFDEDKRRLRDALLAFDPKQAQMLPQESRFVINTKNPLIKQVCQLNEKSPELAEQISKQLYQLSLLSGKEMKPEQLGDFVTKSQRLIASLVNELI